MFLSIKRLFLDKYGVNMVVDLTQTAEGRGSRRAKQYLSIAEGLDKLCSVAKYYDELYEGDKDKDALTDVIVPVIDCIDIEILKALKERSKYKVGRNILENTPQKELEAQGIDTVGWNLDYSKVVEYICEEGDISPDQYDGFIAAEHRLEELLYKRRIIEKTVISVKAPKRKPIERPKRKEEKIAEVMEIAKKSGMNPEVIRDVYQFIIEKNEHIQRVYGKMIGYDGDNDCDMGIGVSEQKG